jgi:hypothetical protein
MSIRIYEFTSGPFVVDNGWTSSFVSSSAAEASLQGELTSPRSKRPQVVKY